MKIIPLGQTFLYKAALLGLLISAFSLTPSWATELVGKPVPLGGAATSLDAKAAGANATVASSAAAPATQAAKAASSAAQLVPPPLPPAVPEAPFPDEMVEATDDMQGAMDDLNNGLDDVFGHHADDRFRPEVLIPIVAITLLFGGPLLVVIILALLYYRAKARRQQNINANIDKLLAAGRDIPVELLLGEEPVVRTQTQVNGITQTSYLPDQAMLHKGVRNIGLGTGWLIFLTIMFGIKLGSFGFVFIGLGISQVIIWKLSTERVAPVKVQD